MEKCLFCYNPISGKGKIKKKEEYIVEKLKSKFDVEVLRSQYAGNIGDEIRKRGEEFDIVVGAGGDGTINEVINAVMSLEKKPKVAFIPAGTVNDVAHSLYIPTHIKKAVANVLNEQTFAHDIMKINERYGIYVCCEGLFTESSYATGQGMKKRMGKIAYVFHGAKKIFSTDALHLKVTYEGGEIEGKFALIIVNNSRYTAGMKINKRANLNDGLFDVVLVESKKERVNLGSVIKVGFIFLRGIEHYIHKKGVYHFQTSSFKVETKDNSIINLDGEKIDSGNFECQMIKEAVNIVVPKPQKLTKKIAKID